MNKLLYIIVLMCFSLYLKAQVPASFTWQTRHGSYYYVSEAKNQQIQGPCGVFAAIAAIEAVSQIYYNNGQYNLLDLSEAYVYNDNSQNGCPGMGCESAPSADVLDFANSTGLIENSCFVFPDSITTCLENCSGYCGSPSQRIFIPDTSSYRIYPTTDAQLKEAILNYGPIIMMPTTSNGCALHSSDPNCNTPHTVLLIGWDGSQWHIKDSWPDSAYIGYRDYSVFSYNPYFFRVYPVNPQDSNDSIRCYGNQSNYFSRKAVDLDGDGFYNWGFDSYPKPNGCPGPDKMDFKDNLPGYIFYDGSSVLQTPTISGTTGIVCPSGSTFTLNNVPSGFSCIWYISKNAYCFSSPTSGSGNSATVYPNSSCIGKEAEITFTISHNGSASYSQSFYANCPREDLMSYSVLDSYGGSPPKYGDTYYLCPYTTYNIFFNENDPNCSVTDLDWILPYGWSEHYRYSNYISIYTNDWPDGFLDIKGKTTCSPSNLVTLMSPYFGAAECGDFFYAYPNPSHDYVDIDVDKNKMGTENISFDAECILSIIDKAGIIKYKTEFKGFPHRIDTSKLPDGLYFVSIDYKGKSSSIRLIIKR